MAETTYYWDVDTDNCFLEEDENGAAIAEYTHEPDLYGELIAQQRGGSASYHNFDGQGSTRELTDQNENVTDTYTYSAFGEELARTGTTENPFGYKGALGYYTNSSTGDIDVRERVYEPKTIRWLSVDPIWPNGAVNGDRYCSTNPINHSDPSGLIDYDLFRDLNLSQCCPCLTEPNDCVIDVDFLQPGDTLTVRWRTDGRDYSKTNTIPTRGPLSDTWMQQLIGLKFGHFRDGVSALVRLRSTSGMDVRDCSITQWVIDNDWVFSNGAYIKRGPKADYVYIRELRNLNYGGWWLYDEPHVGHGPRYLPHQPIVTATFTQFKVWVIGNENVYTYWGFYAIADFTSPAPATQTNALIKKVKWGPDFVRRVSRITRWIPRLIVPWV